MQPPRDSPAEFAAGQLEARQTGEDNLGLFAFGEPQRTDARSAELLD
jgi:hypothetical protein